MISVFLTGNKIEVNLNNSPSFSSAVAILKLNRCQYSPEKHLWTIPISKYDEVINELEEKDDVTKPTHTEIENLLKGNPEQVISASRVKFDYDSMNFPPLVGKAPYEEYQKTDISAGITRNRYAYFLGQGSGKSYIASALISHYYPAKVSKIIFCTSIIGVNNIYHEVQKFIKDFDSSNIAVVDKNNRECFGLSADILVMNYITWRLVCNHYKKSSAKKPSKPWLPIKEWSKGKPTMLLLDESHFCANASSLQGHYMAVNSSLFDYRYLFTGTPADNPEKLYNQFKILDPYLIHRLPFGEWLGIYADIGNRFSAYAVNEWKYEKLESLNKEFVKSYGVYRKTEDIVVLPEHYIKKIRVPMLAKHRKLYESVVSAKIESLADHSPASIVNNVFPYVVMALENPHLLLKHKDKFSSDIESKITSFDLTKDMAKLDYLDEIVNSVQEGNKGVIWCVHPSTVEVIATRYAKLFPLVVHGGVEKDLRTGIIKAFNEDVKHQLIIAVVSTLNTSVSLTAASWQAYVERPANFTEYDQSKYRIYRNGQKVDVTTYELIYERSYDLFRDADLVNKGLLTKGLAGKSFISQSMWKTIFNYNKDSDEGFEF